MTYINNYKNKVFKTIEIAEYICKLVEKFKNFDDSARISDIVNKLNNTIEILGKDNITISVVAAFSAGKSSFINALIFGDEVLHSSVGETTLKLYKIQYGEQLKIVYKERNGKEIVKVLNSLDDLKKEIKNLNSDELDSGSKKYDKFINIFLPEQLLKQGLILIDTPGLNSIREEFVKSYVEDALLESDAVIFITNIDQGANKQDEVIWKEYFKHIQPDSKKWILLNKLDSILTNEMLDEKEKRIEVEKSLKSFSITINGDDNYKKYKVYPISARFALIGKKKGDKQKLESSNLLNFENDLFKSLTENRYKDFIQPEISKIENGITDLNFIFSEKYKEIKNNITFLENKKTFSFDQSAKIAATIKETNSRIEKLKINLVNLTPIVENEFTNLRLSLSTEFELLLIKNLDDFGYTSVFNIKGSITNILNKTCIEFEEYVKKQTGSLSKNISTKFKSILDNYEYVFKIANKELSNIEFKIDNNQSSPKFGEFDKLNTPNNIEADGNIFTEISKSIGVGIAIDTAIATILNYLAKNLGVELAKQILARLAINGVPVIGQIISLIFTGITIYNFPGNVKDKVKNEALPKVKKEIEENINISSNKLKQQILNINNALLDKAKEMSSHLQAAKIKTSNDIDKVNNSIVTYKTELISVETIFSNLKKINIK